MYKSDLTKLKSETSIKTFVILKVFLDLCKARPVSVLVARHDFLLKLLLFIFRSLYCRLGVVELMLCHGKTVLQSGS